MINRAVMVAMGWHGIFSRQAVRDIIPGQGARRVELTPFIPARLSPLLTVNPGGGRGTRLDTQFFVKPAQTLEKLGGYAHEPVSP